VLTLSLPSGPGCAPLTRRGRRHVLIALPTGLRMRRGILAVAARIAADPRWRGLAAQWPGIAALGLAPALLTIAFAEGSRVGLPAPARPSPAFRGMRWWGCGRARA